MGSVFVVTPISPSADKRYSCTTSFISWNIETRMRVLPTNIFNESQRLLKIPRLLLACISRTPLFSRRSSSTSLLKHNLMLKREMNSLKSENPIEKMSSSLSSRLRQVTKAALGVEWQEDLGKPLPPSRPNKSLWRIRGVWILRSEAGVNEYFPPSVNLICLGPNLYIPECNLFFSLKFRDSVKQTTKNKLHVVGVLLPGVFSVIQLELDLTMKISLRLIWLQRLGIVIWIVLLHQIFQMELNACSTHLCTVKGFLWPDLPGLLWSWLRVILLTTFQFQFIISPCSRACIPRSSSACLSFRNASVSEAMLPRERKLSPIIAKTAPRPSALRDETKGGNWCNLLRFMTG